MGNREVHATVDTITAINVDGIESGLRRAFRLAEESYALENVLNNAIQFLFLSIPTHGRSYDSEQEHAYLGRVWLSRHGARTPSTANVEYTPSASEKEKQRYIQKHLGEIHLKKRVFRVIWNDNYDSNVFEIPERVMRDTETVMKMLGLRKTYETIE